MASPHYFNLKMTVYLIVKVDSLYIDYKINLISKMRSEGIVCLKRF